MKIDLTNAFNSIRRDHLIETCIRRALDVILLDHLAYSNHRIMLADCLPIESATSIQQCDPFGPLLFALAVDDAVLSVKFKFSVWYLDDAGISDDVGTVATDIISATNSLCKIGIVVYPYKSEVINVNYSEHHFSKVMQDIQTSLTNAKETTTTDLTILG